MVLATSALTCASSLTSQTMLAVALRPCLAASSSAKSLPVRDVGDHHRGAFGGERRRIVAPDALGAAGDDGAASGEPPHDQFLPVCWRTNFSNASSCSLTMSLVA